MKAQAAIGLFLALSVLQKANGQLRVDPGTDCWYPYKCSTDGVEGSLVTGADTKAAAEKCHADCVAAGAGNCDFFTVNSFRNEHTCYQLTACNQDFDSVCVNKGTCLSGPTDCNAENINLDCPAITAAETPAGTIHWQCTDKDGLVVNGYSGPISPGTTCSLSCESWEDEDGNAGYLQSTCKDDGTWTDTIASGDPANPELKYPTKNDEGLPNTYPTPATKDDVDSPALKCGCKDLHIKWPTDDSQTPWYYDPNFETGTDFICDESTIDADAGRNIITTDNTCKLFCDSHLVANVQCKNGEWTGKPELGFWCYEQPNAENALQPSGGGGGGNP